ncbi:hypothetical protein BDV96DRAFT_607120 [Lophiotrema nucula]|uniref:Uncharacterized protein n=1 Tax=Lophiotrema nucula TaxID=690887 RepID=A0A6A5YKA0_9PLEO|nr:hypothetical protein BDV96DRAFT_607120 [Lophiotrema nucula]
MDQSSAEDTSTKPLDQNPARSVRTKAAMSIASIMGEGPSQPLLNALSISRPPRPMSLGELRTWLKFDLVRFGKAVDDIARADCTLADMYSTHMMHDTLRSEEFYNWLRTAKSEAIALRFKEPDGSAGNITGRVSIKIHPLLRIPAQHENLHFHHKKLSKRDDLDSREISHVQENQDIRNELGTCPLFRTLTSQLSSVRRLGLASDIRLSIIDDDSIANFSEIFRALLGLFREPVTVFIVISCLSRIDEAERNAFLDLLEESKDGIPAAGGKVYVKVILVEAWSNRLQEFLKENGIRYIEVYWDK